MNILIVGLGSISKKHIAAINELGINSRIFALRSSADQDPYPGVINIYHVDERMEFDFALVSNPSHLHLTTIRSLLALNIPLFIEKPALSSLEGAEELIGQVKQLDLMTYVACNLRFHPCIQYIKNYIQEKTPRINEVNSYCGSFLPDWRPGTDYKETYSARVEMGGGVHLDLIHELDYLTWIFGYPQHSRRFLSSNSTLRISSVDYANYLLIYENFCASVVLNYYRKNARRDFEIIFENGVWSIDLLKCEIRDENGRLMFSKPGYSIRDTYLEQMRYFIKSLQSKERNMNTLEESINVLKVCLNEPFKG